MTTTTETRTETYTIGDDIKAKVFYPPQGVKGVKHIVLCQGDDVIVLLPHEIARLKMLAEV